MTTQTRCRSSLFATSFLSLLILLAAGGSVADSTPTAAPSKELKERFRLADRDRDGELSTAEAAEANWFVKQLDRFERLDTDHSGTVTLAEIGAAVSAQVEAWMTADTDHDGRISAAEAEAQSESLADGFRRTDDGDGMLSRQELESLSQRSYYEHSELPSVAPNIFEKRF